MFRFDSVDELRLISVLFEVRPTASGGSAWHVKNKGKVSRVNPYKPEDMAQTGYELLFERLLNET